MGDTGKASDNNPPWVDNVMGEKCCEFLVLATLSPEESGNPRPHTSVWLATNLL
jgi:hypothetical protein